MAVLDASFVVDLDKRHPRAVEVARELAGRGEDLYLPAIAAMEVAVVATDPGLAWARLRDAYTVVSFTDELVEETTGLAARLRKEGRWPGWPDFLVAATAVAYHELLVSEDRKAFRDFPGLRLRTYRR